LALPLKKIKKIIHEDKDNQIILRLTKIEIDIIKNVRKKERIT
jgi:hypothetical protein